MTGNEFLHKVTARYKYNPLWSGILKLTGNNLPDKRWIFITGCYNSGTTLLDQILATHPQISGLPDEGVMLTNQLVRPEDFGWRRMWAECEQEMKNSSRNVNKSSNTIKRQWSHFYDLKKPFLLEKSISNMTRLNFFQENFRPAWFIHIVRNGYAVTEGIYRKAKILKDNPYYGKEHYPINICVRQWVRSLEVFNNVKLELSNVIEIKYEDLTMHPHRVINDILEKLDLDKFPRDYFQKSFSVHEKESKITNMNQSSFERLTKSQVRTITEVAGVYLNKYDYKIIN